MAKLSLLWLYLEIFRPNRQLRYAIYFGMSFTTLFYTSTFIAFCILAVPRPGEGLIGTLLSDGVAQLIPLSIVQGAVNIATDFYIFLLPIPGVLQLQYSTKKKVGVCAIFMTGLLTVELTVGVMCGCMPTSPGFFRHYLPLLRSLGSFFSSRAKGFSLLRPSTKPSSSKSSKRLATKDIKMTLGSQVDGQGRFINSTSVFAREEDWLELGQAAHNPSSFAQKPGGTRREWYEEMMELKR
ncbi:MAG: hypothetical protein Q9201_006621 [Fulgogasparrea decipioides]